MRQTAIEIAPIWAGREERPAIPPRTARAPVWAIAGDRAPCLVRIERDALLIARRVGKTPCRLRVPVSAFESVEIDTQGARFTVRLRHRDPGLTLEFPGTARMAEAVAIRDALVRLLDIEPGRVGQAA